MIPNLISTQMIASELQISEHRVRTLLRDKKLKGAQVGKQWLVSCDDLEFYKQTQNVNPPDRKRKDAPLPKIKALSFFSGVMGLDIGLENVGIHPLLTCELDKSCRQTITANRPDIAMIGDIWNYTASQIREFSGLQPDDVIDVIVGGPPCQAFSTAGARKGFEDKRGNAFLKFIDTVLELQPRYAVIENVRGLLSAPLSHRPHAERGEEWQPSKKEKAGGALLHILRKLRGGGYKVTFNLYNAANFGVPQVRERVVLICTREENSVPHLNPTHSQTGAFGLPPWRTIKDVIHDVKSCNHVDFPESRLKYYRLLSSGQYWKHLPPNLQQEALGKSYFSGGGKTGFLRRLDWNKPSCTLVTTPNMPATDICHPTENRPLSIEEYKRIQQIPDEWIICGNLKAQYKQVGNAVPVGLGEAIGRALLAHMQGFSVLPPETFPFSRYKFTDEKSWDAAQKIS